MILFEANAVAPLVKLPDAAAKETVQWEMVELTAIAARRKAPPLQKPQGWATQLQRHNFKGATSKAQLQSSDFKGERTAALLKRAAYHGF